LLDTFKWLDGNIHLLLEGTRTIELDSLSKSFRGFKAVDELSLRVSDGATVGLLGPNGAGKSTTLKVLTNMIRPTSGRALIDGVDVTNNPKEALAGVGAVIETVDFYPQSTPSEILTFLGSIRGMQTRDIRRRSRELLTVFKLDKWQNSHIGKFSRGMKQRLAIAQALLHEPSVLLLDEPSNGLDPRGMAEIREIIRNLKRNRCTILLSSHLLSEVAEVCDAVALIDKGKLQLYDSIENIERLVSSIRIAVVTVNEIPGDIIPDLRGLKGVIDAELVSTHELLVTCVAQSNQQAEILRYVQARGVTVKSFAPADLSLESLYMKIVSNSR
jgi:ABC-2 type transport system ATP-binding protein